MDKIGSKLNAIWQELRVLGKSINDTNEKTTTDIKSGLEEINQSNKELAIENQDLLKDIRDKKQVDEFTVKNNLTITNDKFEVTGKFYPDTQQIKGKVDIDLSAEAIGKEVGKNIPKAEKIKIPDSYSITGIEKAVEIDGVVETVPLQTNPDTYQNTRLTNGDEYYDLDEKLDDMMEMLGRIPITNGAGLGTGNLPLPTYPLSGMVWEQFDDVQATYPTTTTEKYSYSWENTAFCEIDITYSEPEKINLVSAIRTDV